MKSTKKTLDWCQGLASIRNGQCLASEYKNIHDKIPWKCHVPEHPIWMATSHNINKGTWCPECAGKALGNLEWCQGLASAKNGKCLATKYVGTKTKMPWKCHVPEHPIWMATSNSIQQGTWCIICSGYAPKTIEYIKELALYKKGKCVSNLYTGMSSLYIWECHKGHQWPATASDIQAGYWCPHCAGVAKKDLKWCQDLASAKNGKCLATEYINAKTKIPWKCHVPEHPIWMATSNSIYNGSWCPACSGCPKHDLKWCQDLAKARNGQCLALEYKNSKTKIPWKCHVPEHPIWLAKSCDVANSDSWCPYCVHKTSKGHQSIMDFIKELDSNLEVKPNDRIQIKPLELDIWIPSKNLAIEFCGMYWHGEAHNGTKATQKHYYKFKKCKEKGIRLLTIFESEWIHKQNVVKNLIKNILGYSNNIKINARECTIKALTAYEAQKVLDSNHILGFTRGKYLGLFHETELVAVLVYKIEGNKINITRYCTDSKYQVRGGFGKLLKYLKQFGKEIFTFSDNRFSEGQLYFSLGFKIEKEVVPSYWYFKQNSQLIHKFNFRKARIRKAFPETVFDENDTEIQMTQKLKYDRIWDCGLTKWIYKE